MRVFTWRMRNILIGWPDKRSSAWILVRDICLRQLLAYVWHYALYQPPAHKLQYLCFWVKECRRDNCKQLLLDKSKSSQRMPPLLEHLYERAACMHTYIHIEISTCPVLHCSTAPLLLGCLCQLCSKWQVLKVSLCAFLLSTLFPKGIFYVFQQLLFAA